MVTEAPSPQFKLLADGKDVTPLVEPLLISLEATDDAKDESDSLNMALVWTPQLKPPKRGAVLELQLGWVGQPLATIGQYVVDERSFDCLEKTVSLTAKGTPFNTAKNPKTKALLGQMQSQRRFKWPSSSTLGDVLRTVAQRNGLSLSLSAELAPEPLGGLYQHGESDLHLLNRLAKQFHAVLKINGGTLVFFHTLAPKTPKGKALPQHTLSVSQCSALTVSDGGRNEGGSVVVKYRPTGQKKAQRVTVGGSAGPERRMKKVFSSQRQALAAANSALNKSHHGTKQLQATLTKGDATVCAMHTLVVAGQPEPIGGTKWRITQVRQELASNGWVTSITAEGA
jgi:phage protein D